MTNGLVNLALQCPHWGLKGEGRDVGSSRPVSISIPCWLTSWIRRWLEPLPHGTFLSEVKNTKKSFVCGEAKKSLVLVSRALAPVRPSVDSLVGRTMLIQCAGSLTSDFGCKEQRPLCTATALQERLVLVATLGGSLCHIHQGAGSAVGSFSICQSSGERNWRELGGARLKGRGSRHAGDGAAHGSA